MVSTSIAASGHVAILPPTAEPSADVDRLDDLMSIDDLAAYTGIPKNTLYYWRARGSGPRAMKLGKYVRYRRRDVQAWLDASLEKDR